MTQQLEPVRASADVFEYDAYQRNHRTISKLKEQLPEHLVVDMVREVIRRVSSKDTTIAHAATEPSHADLVTLSEALIAPDDRAARDIVATLRADGTAPEAIYVKHLARSAQMLGDWWSEDRINFTAVTIATGRMFAIMRGMRHLFEPATVSHAKQAIFASVPGEDHTMGVRMAADIFRKDGWDIDLKVGLDHDTLVAQIEDMPCRIIGLSLSGVHSIEPLSRLVLALHISCPQARLYVSGPGVAESRDILELMDLDGIAETIDDARTRFANALNDPQASVAV